MNNEVLFTETERYRQWWVWLMAPVVLGVNGILLIAVCKQVLDGLPGGSMNNTALPTGTGILLLLTTLFLAIRLDNTVNSNGIQVRFFPFHLKPRYYAWSEVAQAHVRRYSATGESGGWGVRVGRSGKAFTVSGNHGLELEFTDRSRKLLIGTKRPDELTRALNDITRPGR